MTNSKPVLKKQKKDDSWDGSWQLGDPYVADGLKMSEERRQQLFPNKYPRVGFGGEIIPPRR